MGNLNISPEVVRGLSTGVVSAIISGLAVHLVEKVKYSRLKRDNKRLVQEGEEVKSDYSKQLEELKRDHQLDLQKRKYRYESKTRSYSNFFAKIDEMNTEINIKSGEKMQMYIAEYTKNLMRSVTEKEQQKATVNYQKRTQSLMMDASAGLVKLRHETSEIRLHASDAVVKYLDLLESGYSKLVDEGNHLLAEMPQLMESKSEEVLQLLQAPLLQQANVVEYIKGELIKQMRLELQEI